MRFFLIKRTKVLGLQVFYGPEQMGKRWQLFCCIFQMEGLSSIQMEFKGQFSIQPLFDHLNTKLVWFSDPHCTLLLRKKTVVLF